MKLRFWHMRIGIGFVVPHGHYEWNIMTFVLKNALSKFQHVMDKVYKPISKFCLVYIDDVLIFNNSKK